MKCKFITGEPEAIVSRGFVRADLTEFDAVVIVRNQKGLPFNDALAEFIGDLCEAADLVQIHQVPDE